MKNKGQSLELFYIDGHPDGMVSAELYNWTGHVLMCPRTQLAEALLRQESRYAGIYLLLGEQNGEQRAYIGEGEDIAARIWSHDVNKDWWTGAVLVTAAANKLNKAHVRYLEARLISHARLIGRIPLENGTNPATPSLSEADVAKMEMFLENLFVVLPAVRVDMFITRTRPAALGITNELKEDSSLQRADKSAAMAGNGHKFRLQLKRDDFTADATLNASGEFVVLAGSQARPLQNAGSYKDLYNELMRSGVIAEDSNGQLRFEKSYAFNSPSAASSVVTGRSSNGAKEWKHVPTGLPYKEWEAKRIEAYIDPLFDDEAR